MIIRRCGARIGIGHLGVELGTGVSYLGVEFGTEVGHLGVKLESAEIVPTSSFFFFENIEVPDDVGVLAVFPIRIPSSIDSPIFTKFAKLALTADTILEDLEERLDFADERNLVGRWGGRFEIWEGFLEFASSLVASKKDFANLETNLVDSRIDSMEDSGMDFVDLGVNLVDLGMNFVDLQMGFGDLGMDSEMGFAGLEMDFMDGKHLGYFHDWYFGKVEGQRWTICYLADPRE
ncbi:hypothetical protein FXO38_08434 [Capsicum annuum]|nr:hypothetical protein FXO38_08434 [Capsicum annuum]